jgi:hypothetical protein
LFGALSVGALGGGYYAFAARKDPVEAAKELTEAQYKNKTPAQGGPPDKVFLGGGMDCDFSLGRDTIDAAQTKASSA